MSFDAHANFAYTVIDTPPAPAASGLSLTVATGFGALFPAAPFNAVVYPNGLAPLASNAEILRVTSKGSGDDWTIVRAQEGSNARTILAGDQIAAAITAKTLTDVETAIPSIAGLLSAINVSAGTTSNNLSALTFSDGSGVSFGLNGSVVTAMVATNYQSQGAYLTTAALSQDSSKYAGTNGAMTGGSITVNTAGVSVDLPAYLTTAMASNRGSDFVQATAVFNGTNASGTIASNAISISVAPAAGSFNLSAGTTSNLLSKVTFADSNGVSFGLNASTITATVKTDYQTSGAYLTTAMQSNAVTLSNINVSGGTTSSNLSAVKFIDSNGVSWSLDTGSKIYATVKTDYQTSGAYLTTAMASNRGSDFVQATAAFHGTNISGTINSNDLSLSVAAPSAASINFSAGTTSNNLTQVSFKNTNGVSFGLDAGTITATVATNYQSQGAYLTTAALSQDSSKYAGTNGAITGGSITVNTSGVSVNLPAYLTTAALSGDTSKYVQAWEITGNTSGTTSSAQGTKLYFSGGNSLTISGNSNTLVFSVGNYLTTAALSQDSSKYAGTGFTSAGANIGLSGTQNTAGLSLSATVAAPIPIATAVKAVGSAGSTGTITRYAPEDHQHAGVAAIGISTSGNTAGTTGSEVGTYWIQGGNSITVSQITSNNGSHTLVISAGNYLTTAALSADSSKYAGTGFTSAGANIGLSGTHNTAGLSLSATVAAQSNQSAIKAFGVSNTGQTAGNTGVSTGIDWVLAGSQSITLSQSTAGGGPNTVWFQHPAWLTTAALSGDTSKYVQAWELTGNTAGTTSSAQGTKIYFSGGNSITVSGNSNTIVLSVGAYLTTARASTDAIGLNTAKTNVTWTVNSSGLSLDAGGYAGTGTSATNATITLNTAGLAISVAAPGAAAEANWHTLTGNVVGNSSASGSTIAWSGGNGVTLSGTNNSVIGISVSTYSTTSFNTVGSATTVQAVGSANSVGTVTRWANEDHVHAGIGAIGISTSGNTAGTTGSEQGTYWIQGGNQITVSQITSNNGSHTLVISGPSPYCGWLEPFQMTNTVTLAPAAGSWYFAPFIAPEYMSGGRINFLHVNTSTAGIVRDITGGSYVSSSSGGKNQSYTYSKAAALYSQGTGTNSTRLESFWSNSFSFGLSHRVLVSQSGANSSVSVTVSQSISYISEIGSDGAYTLNQFASNNNSNGTNTSIASAALDSVGVSIRNMLSDSVIIPIGFNTTIQPGAYWMAVAWSSTTASATSQTSFAGASALMFSQIGQVGISRLLLEASWRNWASTATTARSHIMPYGVYTGAANMAPPQFVALSSDLSSLGSAWVPYFNFQNQGITK